MAGEVAAKRGAAALSAVALIALPGCGGDETGQAQQQHAAGLQSSLATTTTLASAEPARLASAGSSNSGPLILGVQTHFSQGWTGSAVDQARAVGASLLRDSLPWESGEPRQGVYDFTGATAQKLDAACASGFRLILTEVPRHGAYGGDDLVATSRGQEAYARYLNALLGRFGSCVAAVEVGNELNGLTNLGYPASVDGKAAYMAQLRAIRSITAPQRPDVAILGGSTNMIGTGFLADLFAQGMLDLVDGVPVHPYTVNASGLALELNHLRDVMGQHGAPVPIWVTEFSHDTRDRDAAAAEVLRSVTLLAASPAHAASWYALLHQDFFPNMGLFEGGALKPVGEAYAFAQRRLLPLGRPVRVDVGDPLVFVYRFGPSTLVAWSGGRKVTIPAGAQVFDARGRRLSTSGSINLGPEPLVIDGGQSVAPDGAPDVLADTLYDFGSGVWQYIARTSNGRDNVLALFDGTFDSYFGDRWYRPLRINLAGGAAAGDGSRPIRAVWRYNVPATQRVTFSACFTKARRGDGVDIGLYHNGRLLASRVLLDGEASFAPTIDAAAGDRLEFAVGPNRTAGGDAFSYRARVTRTGSGAAPATCP